jgi:hypothetical protein
MSEELVAEPFDAAAKKVEDAYEAAAEQLKIKVRKSKSDALKKISH